MNLNDSRQQAIVALSTVAVVAVVFLIAYAFHVSIEREKEKTYIKSLAWGAHFIPHPRDPYVPPAPNPIGPNGASLKGVDETDVGS